MSNIMMLVDCMEVMPETSFCLWKGHITGCVTLCLKFTFVFRGLCFAEVDNLDGHKTFGNIKLITFRE